jgi:hypothetical protein
MIGAGVGVKSGGLPGAATGFVLGPTLEAALGSGATTKLQTAKLMTKLAKALRRGDEGHVASLLTQLKALPKSLGQETKAGVKAGARVGATSPSVSQQPSEITLSIP